MNRSQPDPLVAIAALLAERRLAIDGLEEAYAEYCRVFATSAPRLKPNAKGKVSIAAGSLEDRILGLAAEPVTLKALVDGAGARKGDVKKAVKALVASGAVTLTGHSRGARYQKA